MLYGPLRVEEIYEGLGSISPEPSSALNPKPLAQTLNHHPNPAAQTLVIDRATISELPMEPICDFFI